MKLLRGSKSIAAPCWLLLTVANFFLYPFRAPAEGTAVIYPDVRVPYEQVFLDIAEGVSAAQSGTVKRHPLGENDTPEKLLAWLSENRIDKVIALGKRGLETRPQLAPYLTIVNGAVVLDLDAQGISGISLTPAPRQMFRKLRELVPTIKEIHVIHSTTKNGRLIKLAESAAAETELRLMPQKTTSIQDTAARYQAVLSTMNSHTSALWLHHTGRSIDRAIMAQILEMAWQRNLVVFSSNFADVKRGVLFSLYPDNYLMGMHLAQLADKLQQQQPRGAHQVLLLEALLTAVNLRTADHLGLYFGKSEKQTFDFMYPPP